MCLQPMLPVYFNCKFNVITNEGYQILNKIQYRRAPVWWLLSPSRIVCHPIPLCIVVCYRGRSRTISSLSHTPLRFSSTVSISFEFTNLSLYKLSSLPFLKHFAQRLKPGHPSHCQPISSRIIVLKIVKHFRHVRTIHSRR